MVLHIVWMIILGLVVGLIARAVVPGRQPMGWIATALLGVVGAYVGGTLGSVVFPPHHFDIHPPIKHAFLGALVGAVLLLVVYKLATSGPGPCKRFVQLDQSDAATTLRLVIGRL